MSTGEKKKKKELYAFSHGFTTRLINAGIDVNNTTYCRPIHFIERVKLFRAG